MQEQRAQRRMAAELALGVALLKLATRIPIVGRRRGSVDTVLRRRRLTAGLLAGIC